MGKTRTHLPTSEQANLIARHGLIPSNFRVVADTDESLQLVSRLGGTTRRIKKAAGVGAPSSSRV